MSLAFLLGFAAAATPACPDAPSDRVYSLGMTVHGHSVGGLAVVSTTPDSFTLVALAPTGPELFSIQRHGEATTIDSPLPEWKPWLARIPFERDLGLVSPPLVGSCTTPAGRVHVRDHRRRWRGAGGPARAAQQADGRWVLHDPWRGYTLTLREVG